MAASNYLENAILEHIFEGNAFPQPDEIWVGLSRQDPGEDGAGLDEPDGKGYLRVRPADSGGRWDIGTSNDVTTVKNKGSVTFPEATDDWGEITHIAIFDEGTDGQDGELLLSFEITHAQEVDSGNVLAIQAGDLEVRLD